MNLIEQVRKERPLIHHLTNQVVMNFTANGLLSFGGSPIMAKEPSEIRNIVGIAKGVLINIGAMVEKDLKAMIIAGQTANERGIPVVLDPVGVGASHFRKQIIQILLEEISFTAIKGNAGEMAHLVAIEWETKGVDAIGNNSSKLAEIAQLVAEKYNTLAVVTGEMDMIYHNGKLKENSTGHEYLTRITGAGCLLGSIITACLTAQAEKLAAAYKAVQFYGLAAEKAAQRSDVKGTGTFLPAFIDELGK